MLLRTSIQPRLDDTVIAEPPSGRQYIFKFNKDDELVCEVSDQGDILFLVKTGNFSFVESKTEAAAIDVSPSPEDVGKSELPSTGLTGVARPTGRGRTAIKRSA